MSRLYNILNKLADRTIAYQPGDTLVLGGYYHALTGGNGKSWGMSVTVPKEIPTSLSLSVSGTVNNIVTTTGSSSTSVTVDSVSRTTANSIYVSGSIANDVGAQKIANLAAGSITVTFS